MDNVDNLSTFSVDKLHGMAGNVDSVDKLSTSDVDKRYITACFVDNVENLSTRHVDNFCSYVSVVESVEKLSTILVDKYKSGKKKKNAPSYPQYLWITRWKNVQKSTSRSPGSLSRSCSCNYQIQWLPDMFLC